VLQSAYSLRSVNSDNRDSGLWGGSHGADLIATAAFALKTLSKKPHLERVWSETRASGHRNRSRPRLEGSLDDQVFFNFTSVPQPSLDAYGNARSDPRYLANPAQKKKTMDLAIGSP